MFGTDAEWEKTKKLIKKRFDAMNSGDKFEDLYSQLLWDALITDDWELELKKEGK
jgi:hypothetical protein